MTERSYKVDLTDPGTLRSVLEGYLRLKVCPVQSDRRPQLLFPATVEMLLPDGSSMSRWGTVIRYMGEGGFLVQFDGPLDLTTLDELANLPAKVPAARPTLPADERMFVPDPDFEPEADFEPAPTPPRPTPPPTPVPEAVYEDPESGSGTPPTVEPPPAAEPPPIVETAPAAAPRFGPTVDAFVAGPDPDSAPEPPDEPDAFGGDRTTLHEADEVIAEAIIDEEYEATSDGEDPFADLLEEAAGEVPGPGAEEEAHMGIPDGWSLASADHTIPPEELEAQEDAEAAAPTAQMSAAPEPYEIDDASDAPAAAGPDPPEPKTPLTTTEMSAIYKQFATLSPTEKQRLARSGNRITRGLLAKDRNKNIHQFVFRNPKISVEEVAEYAKLPALSKDAIRIIASSRTWLASRQVVMGLVRNPGTPADLLPGLVQRLGPGQWQILAKSGDVKAQVSSLAKKLLLASRR